MFDFSSFKQKLEKILEHAQQEFGMLRTGKATPSLLDSVRVQAYGTTMAVNELANVNAPDNNMLIIDPWDKNVIGEIEKAINKAELNLNPVVDRDIIRIVIPPLTEEIRKELVKKVHQKAESSKVMMRTTRSDIKSEVEDQEGQSGVSEDDIRRDLEELDKIMDEYEDRLDEIVTSKEKELLQI